MNITKNTKILSKKSEDSITQDNAKLFKRRFDDIRTKLDNKLQGCSAIQLGFPVKTFIMRNPKTKEFYMVNNPELHWKFGIRHSYEGCLSVESRYYVWRPLIICASWEDEDLNRKKKILGPKMTRIFMHEYDHLQGITIANKGVKCNVSNMPQIQQLHNSKTRTKSKG